MHSDATTCECGGISTVEETRPTSGGRIRRRRKCPSCGLTWRTYEARHVEVSLLDAATAEAANVAAHAEGIGLRATAAMGSLQ